MSPLALASTLARIMRGDRAVPSVASASVESRFPLAVGVRRWRAGGALLLPATSEQLHVEGSEPLEFQPGPTYQRLLPAPSFGEWDASRGGAVARGQAQTTVANARARARVRVHRVYMLVCKLYGQRMPSTSTRVGGLAEHMYQCCS